MLKSNSKIDKHIDAGKSLSICHRVHIPIITNKNVLFEIDNEIKNLKEGEMWEINNSEKIHSVVNNSNTDRIHLIVDWIND
jgi:aspartyl/asparaginyl beta-hydroxylase (cupin superfamily)